MKKYLFTLIILLQVLTFTLYPLAASPVYADLSGCSPIPVGNPSKNQPVPAGCGSESAIVQNVIAYAKAHLTTGIYVWGAPSRNWASENPNGNAPTQFDCSGFVGWAWYWGSGGKVSMQGQTQADWDAAQSSSNSFETLHVTSNESELQPGDAIYFGANTSSTEHVGLYVGKDPGSSCKANDCFVQYYQTGLPGNEVSLADVSSPGFEFLGFIRFNVN